MSASGSGNVLKLYSSTVTGGQINPGTGQVTLDHGTLSNTTVGGGQVVVEGVSELKGVNELSPGTNLTINNGQTLYLSAGSSNILNNKGTLLLNASGSATFLTTYGSVATLNGPGGITLGGDAVNNYLDGPFINNSTIQGGGYLRGLGTTNNITNNGQIIANNKILYVGWSGTNIDNSNGVMSASGSGNELYINVSTVTGGQINPGTGQLTLYGATLSNTKIGAGQVVVQPGGSYLKGVTELAAGTTLTVKSGNLYLMDGSDNILNNNGEVLLNSSYSVLMAGGANYSTLNGLGRVTLGGDLTGNSLAGTGFINNSTIQGGGSLKAPIDNNGRIIASNKTLQVDKAITGDGSVRVSDNATLKVNANIHAGDVSLDQLSTLNVTSGLGLALSGNFTFAQKNPGLWNWGTNAFLAMDGAGLIKQSLEIGGRDGGLVNSFFADNFDLNKLSLSGANTYAFLSDGIDNGHRSSAEALYVDNLYVYGFGDPTKEHANLNLNGLHLYAMKDSSPYRVTIADDYAAWLGGGHIIDQAVFNTPLPAAWLLFGSALLGLAGWQSRKR